MSDPVKVFLCSWAVILQLNGRPDSQDMWFEIDTYDYYGVCHMRDVLADNLFLVSTTNRIIYMIGRYWRAVVMRYAKILLDRKGHNIITSDLYGGSNMKHIKLNQLSLLGRASEAYATGALSEVKERAEDLYLGKRYPFVISAEHPFPLHLFSPRLVAMLKGESGYPDAEITWDIISSRECIIKMISATEIRRPAAEILGPMFESIFPPDSDDSIMMRKQMMGYMIKVVMECFGYTTHLGRRQIDTTRGPGDTVRRSNYFKTGTLYEKMTEVQRDALLDQI